MSDVNKQQQTIVGGQNSQQQQQQQQQQQSQAVEGQSMQVQMAQDGGGSDQIQGTQVISTNTTMNSTSTMVMAAPPPALISQQALPNLQSPPALAAMPAITPQQMTDWAAQGRLQVIQQPLQNPTYIQPVYNAQGQLIVPGNLALHPGNMNQPIQLIAAGKPFQPGQFPQMLAAPGKPFLQGQTTPFPSYATIPTSASNQTLVISQLGVIGQTNILPPPQGKPQEAQKVHSKTNSNNGNVKSTQTQQQNMSIGSLVTTQTQGLTTQAQTFFQPQIISPIQYACNTQQQRGVQGAAPTMQFAPWPATFGPPSLPQALTWAPGIQSSAVLTQGSQIFIRNSQTEQTGMFIQNAQSSTLPQLNPMSGQQMNKTSQSVEMAANVQAKGSFSKGFSTILPNSFGSQQFRSAGSVSTQTGQTQTGSHQPTLRGGHRSRSKNLGRVPNMIPISKTDFASHSKSSTAVHVLQQKFVVSNVASGCGPHDNKLPKQTTTSSHSGGSQQPPQPLTQMQQMQNAFPEPVDQKPPGQLMLTNGHGSGGSVMAMPPAPMAPLVGNMIMQSMQGIPGVAIPTGQPLQGGPMAQELTATSGMVPLNTEIKQEIPEDKEMENDGASVGPGRPGDENPSGSESSLAAGNSSADNKGGRSQTLDVSVLDNLTEEEKKLDKERQMLLSQAKATVLVKPQVLTHVIEGFVIQESSEPFPVNRPTVDSLVRRPPVGAEGGEPSAKKPLIAAKQEPNEEHRVDPLKWTVAEVCAFVRKVPEAAEYAEEFALQDIDGEALMLLQPDHLVSAMSMKLGPAVKIIAKIDTMRVNPETPSEDED